MSRLTRVHLNPTDSDAYEVCRSIVRNIAPVATGKFGATTVLEVTGSRRPILAVLLGQIVETQVVTTGRLPAALVSEDIASWLGDRLLEDNFVTSAPSEGVELPAHMIAAAICLASAPAEPEHLVRIMSDAIGHENVEVASLALERLQRFGWLIDVDGQLAAAHDVVVDKILESVVLHHDSGIVRQKTLHAMLNTARSSARAFSNVVASLERVLDERTAREETTLNIQSSSTEWLVGFSQEGTTLLPGTPVERARVVTQVLDSGLWTNGASERWASIGSDLLSTIEDDPASADAFLVACRTLEKDVIPPISERAVRWVSRSGATVDEFVLNACLSRRDVYGETAEILLNLAIESISLRAGDVTTDFTLRRLLRRTDLRSTDLVSVSEFARDWLELHGGSDHATHLISAVIDREDVREVTPDIWQLAYDKALAWIEAHPTMLDGALALESLIRSNFTGSHFDAKIWPRALEWLQNNYSEHSAVYVLGALLKSAWVRDDHADIIMSFTSQWVADHLDGRGATFVLKPLVSWELGQGDRDATTWDIVDEWFRITGDVENAAWILREAMRSRRASDPIAHRIWAQVRRWILRHGSRSDARLVLTDALAWQYVGEGSDAILSGAAERWLGLHLDRYECSYLMQSALESPLVDKHSSERILVLVDQWISRNVNAPALSHILQAAMERALKSGVDLTGYMWQRIEGWLEEFGDSPAAAYIIRTILKFTDLPAERLIFIACCASKWLKSAPNTSSEVRVVRSLLSHYPPKTPGFEVVSSCVSSWLRAATPPPGPEVSHLLQELTEWMPSTEVWADIWTLAEKVLPLDDGKAGGYVIQTLLARHPPGEILRDESWYAIRSWLAVHATSRHSAYTHMSVLGFGSLTSEQAESLWPGVNRWLALHSDDDATTLSVLRACINSPHLSRDALDIFWPILEKQFGTLATRIKSLNTLVELASVSIYSNEERATFWACAMRWLDRFGASYDATFLIQALVKMKSSPVQQELLWEYIFKWCLLYGTDEKATFLYTALLRWHGLASARASRLVEVLKHWMHANTHSSRGTRLVISVIRSERISHRQLVDFGSAARLWLSKQRGNQRRKEVQRVTSSRSISSNRSKVARAALALEK